MKNICLSILLVGALTTPVAGQGDPEKGFEPLFDGHDLSQWEEVDGFVVDDGTILTRGAKAGALFRARIPRTDSLAFGEITAMTSSLWVIYGDRLMAYQVVKVSFFTSMEIPGLVNRPVMNGP